MSRSITQLRSPTSFSADSHRLQRRTPRSIAVRVGMEQRLHLRLQIQTHDRLSDTVCHGGHAEDSDPACPCFFGISTARTGAGK